MRATKSAHYLMPRHIGEIDRLDLQHYAFRVVLGTHYQAPVENVRTAFTRLLEARVGVRAAERTELLKRVQEEYEEQHVTVTWAIAYGRRPM